MSHVSYFLFACVCVHIRMGSDYEVVFKGNVSSDNIWAVIMKLYLMFRQYMGSDFMMLYLRVILVQTIYGQ